MRAASGARQRHGVVPAVSEEFGREPRASRLGSSEQRRQEQIERLLNGEPVDASELTYRVDDHHLGLLATRREVAGSLRDFARSIDRRLLTVARADGTLWAWLGGRRALDPAEIEPQLAESLPADVCLALGEPAEGLAGWRLTHRQAAAALAVALRGEERVVRYADVALLASVIHDDLLCASLRSLYLAPLERGPDGGEVALRTLRAYFAADRNVSSAAAALEVKRHTVTNRLRTIEAVIGHSLNSCAMSMGLALRLHDLTGTHIDALASYRQLDPTKC